MKTLVTGGAGFIGSHLAEKLVQEGHEVVVLDDLSGGFEHNVPDGAKFIKASILDHETLEDLFTQERFDYVYHLAAYAAEGLSHFIRRYNYENNLIGSVNLINLSVKYKIKHFVFTSSMAVYGEQKVPFHEWDTARPVDPYGIAKYAVEQDLKTAYSLFGLTHTIFRPHNVYGPRQNIGDRYRNVVGIFMNQVMEDKPMTIYGDGTQTRAFSYVTDIIPPMIQCLKNKRMHQEVFNIGGEKPYTIIRLANKIAQTFKVPLNVRFQEARNEVHEAYCSHEKLASVLGPNENMMPIEQGLKEMAGWVIERGVQKTKPFANIEITEKLPSFWKDELNNP